MYQYSDYLLAFVVSENINFCLCVWFVAENQFPLCGKTKYDEAAEISFSISLQYFNISIAAILYIQA